ncbi:hypothetical protein MLPF_1395 [Mycobacterium lepromatosis]|uniref:hypothetical protein n=1 Tax=Mycobacterium lepromatosis TaxID=480418 RepID=UPI000B012DA8|nr:hypothetical protein [Mycobacterium lepromatosis]UKN42192.1 hypothetical protein MLPF_1395 [Mycobacterium lepromatosis]
MGVSRIYLTVVVPVNSGLVLLALGLGAISVEMLSTPVLAGLVTAAFGAPELLARAVVVVWWSGVLVFVAGIVGRFHRWQVK